MINNLLKVLVLAALAVTSLSGCTISNSRDGLDEFDREMIKDQIRSELAEIPSFDSIANTQVIVSPSITVRKKSNNTEKVIVICIPFLFTLAVLWICLYYKRANMLDKYRVISESIDKGVQLPDTFYNNGKNPGVYRRNKDLKGGMMWIAIGVFGIIFFSVVSSEEMIAICTLPVLVGIVKIISAIIENRSAETVNDKN